MASERLRRMGRRLDRLEQNRRQGPPPDRLSPQQRAARESMLAFTEATSPRYSTNWHHSLIARHLDDLAAGRIKRLMVFAHPRSGKSQLVSRSFPAYLLGKNPNLQLLACSHTVSLAREMSLDVQRIMDRPAYRALFPESTLAGPYQRYPGRWGRTADRFSVVGHEGVYRAAGVGKATVGFGFDIGIVDDPIRSAEEARSVVLRERQWQWFVQEFLTRQNHGAGILLTLTRWTHDDVVGRLLRLIEDDPAAEPWVILRLPAIAGRDRAHPEDPRTEGEALWPARYGLPFLLGQKAVIGAYHFGALYDQNPKAREGALFPRENWKIVPVLPAGRHTWARYWDKGYSARGDWTVGILGCRTVEGRFYLVDEQRIRTMPRERNQLILNTAATDRQSYGHVQTYIEQPPGAGAETTDTLVRLLAGFPVKVSLPRGDKEERAEPLSDQCEAGNVHLIEGKWVKGFLDEMETFPGGINDDRADAASGVFHALALPQDLCPGKAIEAAERAPLWRATEGQRQSRMDEESEERGRPRFFGRK